MATENSSYPPLPANYVTILDLQEQWMKRQREKQEKVEKEQQPKHKPTLSQRRNRASHGKGRPSGAAIAPPSTCPVPEIATLAEEFRVSGVEEPSALVDVPAVEAVDRRRESNPYKKRKKKKKKKRFGIDGKGKAMLGEDADGGGELAAVDEVAGESVVSVELPKDGSFKAMQEFLPKIKSRNVASARKMAGKGTATEKVLKVEPVRVKVKNNDESPDTETRSKIKSAYHPNPTSEMAEGFKKLSTQDDGLQRRGYGRGGRRGGRGRGRGRRGPNSRDHTLNRGEMVWVKKGEKADDGHDQSRS